MPDEYKPISLKPLSGVLETRAMPEDASGGYIRVRENFQINAAGRMGRRQGFQKFLSTTSGYNNQDLHDQMIAAQIYYDETDPVSDGSEGVRDYPPGNLCATVRKIREQTREHPTLLFQAISTSGIRYWIVGTQSRLYELNVATGAYRLLGDGWGGATSDTLAIRFRVGQVKDTLVFTNDIDKPFSYTLGDEVNGCSMRATREISDLDLIKLTKATEVVSFKGHILLFNVTMDGGRLANRFLWSDLLLGAGSLKELIPGSATAAGSRNDPRSYRASPSFDPAVTDTIAGYSDLPFGHRILRATEFGKRILIFTNRGIFAADATGAADKAFDWVELYKHADGARCLAYPNIFINSGDAIRYGGRDGIYKWDAFTVEPEREEWLHRGTGEMYANLNKTACETHCAGYTASDSELGEEREILISYAENGHDIPNRTLTIQPEQRFVSPLDHGFTAFGNCQPDSRPSINDFVRQNCVCEDTDISQENIKTGLPSTDPVCSGLAQSLCTSAEVLVDGESVYVEDYDAAVCDDDSLCALLNGQKLDDICIGCEGETVFVGASSRDKCLKQIGTSMSREFCLSADVAFGALNGFAYINARGVYSFDGYYSKLVIGPHPLGDKTIEKNIRNFMLELEVPEEIVRNVIALRVGYSYNPLDPTKTDCGVVWGQQRRRELSCPQALATSEYRQRNLRPHQGKDWAVFVTGRFLYFELIIAGLRTPSDLKSDLIPCLGGESYFSSAVVEARKA